MAKIIITSTNCTIREVSKDVATRFNTENAGAVNASQFNKYYGYYYGSILVYVLYANIGTNGGLTSYAAFPPAVIHKNYTISDWSSVGYSRIVNYAIEQNPIRVSSTNCTIKEISSTEATKFNTENGGKVNASQFNKYYGYYYGSLLVYVLYANIGANGGLTSYAAFPPAVIRKNYTITDWSSVAYSKIVNYARTQNPVRISSTNCTIKEVSSTEATNFNTENGGSVSVAKYNKYYGYYYGSLLVYVLYANIGANGGLTSYAAFPPAVIRKNYTITDWSSVGYSRIVSYATEQNPIRVSSTNCTIKEISSTEATKFNTENGGKVNASQFNKYYGYYYGSVLVYVLYANIGTNGGLTSYAAFPPAVIRKNYTITDWSSVAYSKIVNYARTQNPVRISSTNCTIKEVSSTEATKFNTDNEGKVNVSQYNKYYGYYYGSTLVYVLYANIGTNGGLTSYAAFPPAVIHKNYTITDWSSVGYSKIVNYARTQNPVRISSVNCTIKEISSTDATNFNTDNGGGVNVSQYNKYYGLYYGSALVYVLYATIGTNGGVSGTNVMTNKYYALSDLSVAKDKLYNYAKIQNSIKIRSTDCNITEVIDNVAKTFYIDNGGAEDISKYSKYYGYYYNNTTLVGVLYVQIGANGEVQASVFKSHKYYSITDGDACILNYANAQNLKEIDIINEVNAWKVEKLTDNIVKQFYTNNSGQFIDKALYCGLYYNNDLVAVLAAKHTSTAAKHIVEKLSYNEKKYYKIIHGESFLLHYAKSQYPNKVKLDDQISAWSAYIINDEATLKIFYIENNGGDISQTADAFYGLYYNDDLVAISAVRVGDDGNVIEESYCTSTEYERSAGDVDGGIVGGHAFLRKQVQIANQIKVYSRDCKIVTVSAPTATLFYQQNEGGDISPEADAFYGLYYNNEIIAIMAFKNNTKLHYCWKPNFSISEGEIYLNQYVSAMSQINGTNETSKKVLEIASSSNTIPFDQMIGAPLIACVNAQSMASMETLKFVKEAGFKKSEKEGSDFEVVNVSFSYKNGNEMFSLSVPLLTIIPVPYLQIDTVKINFSADMYTTENNEVVAKFATTDLSAEKKQTSKYNVQNQLNIEIKASSGSMPSGMAKMLDIFNNCIEVSQEVVEKNSLEMPTEHMTEAAPIIEDTPSVVENEEDAVEDESGSSAQQTPDSTQKTSTKKSKKK
ncbi:MAG: DUF2589 domain-containing protein [Bacteroidales bacterium]|nr:DUF2589 domain-containing protein [Bacteroidales bacterium]